MYHTIRRQAWSQGKTKEETKKESSRIWALHPCEGSA